MPGKTIADARERDRQPAPGPRRGSQARVLRIIAGTWRGRRLRFPAQAAIRPTPDRVRETLFNWLGGAVAGARCLDLFAGSGALGLEALSRGAASVQFIERDSVAARALAQRLEEWGASGTGRVQRADALAWLAERPIARRAMAERAVAERPITGRPMGERPMGERPVQFDIAFVDPPFDSDLARAAAERLEARGWLAEHALIYLEHPARGGLPPLPERWKVRKSGRAGEVGYHLLERVLERAEK